MPKMPSLATPPIPTQATLRKYGLTEQGWWAICERQGWACPICREPFGDRKLAIDHDHVAGFKAHKKRKGKKVRAMKPAERVKHVRGILHAFCNRFVRRWLTLERATAIVAYLQAYEERRNADARSQPRRS